MPAYSPDFAPIEQAFARVKGIVHAIGARTKKALELAIARGRDAITPRDAHGFFRHFGFQVPPVAPCNGCYATDLSDAEWMIFEPLLPPPKGGGRPRGSPKRTITDGIFYVNRSDCPWRLLPSDFPPWQTASRKRDFSGHFRVGTPKPRKRL